MSDDCNNECSGCGEACDERKEPTDFQEKLNDRSKVKKVIGIISGKGGVGKSMVTSMMAVTMNRRGHRTAILDADVTGPSIPKAFGIKDKATEVDGKIMPAITKTGIQVMSINLLLEKETDPVIWRGPLIGGAIKQFWTDVVWEDVDYMFIDMPPGTGDVALTVFQSLPVDGIIVVTSPQELVSMIVAKAVQMAKMMNVPILGIIENMSYFTAPDSNKDYNVFGESHIEEVAADFGIQVLAKVPINPEIAMSIDKGLMELYPDELFIPAAEYLETI